MINRKFIHFERYESFLHMKVAADPENTTYTYGCVGEVLAGEPDISWGSIVYVKDSKFICTHGQIYDASGMSTKFKTSVKINGTDFDGSEDITTTSWGEAREIKISDGTNFSDPVSVDGSGNMILLLPEDIDANVSKDSEGRLIIDTYPTKTELQEALDELPTFFVYSGEDDSDPTLLTEPASLWDTDELKNLHAGDYYVTTTGRIFKFEESTEGIWGWTEITDYYLYQCLEDISDIRGQIDLSNSWAEIQTSIPTGNIVVRRNAENKAYLDVLSCPQHVNYKVLSDVTIHLPFLYGGVYTRVITKHSDRAGHLMTLDDFSDTVGKTIIVTNTSESSGNIVLVTGDSSSGTNQSVTVEPGKVCILEFKTSVVSGYIVYYWESNLADLNSLGT